MFTEGVRLRREDWTNEPSRFALFEALLFALCSSRLFSLGFEGEWVRRWVI